MKKLPLVAVGLLAVFASAACSSAADNKLPSGSDKFPTSSSTSSAGGVVETTAPTTKVTTATTSSASSCDVVREALLTGTPAEIKASMRALMADKAADATAREYADYYLNRDKANAQMQEMDVSLIRMSCAY